MTKRMLIDATHAEETRVVVLDGNRLEDFDVETSTKRQLKGNIYLAKVVRVEPSLQAAFVEYGGNRHGFLAFSEIHPDYYQIPVADRQRLLELQAEEARREEEEAELELALNQGADQPSPDEFKDSANEEQGVAPEPWSLAATPLLIAPEKVMAVTEEVALSTEPAAGAIAPPHEEAPNAEEGSAGESQAEAWALPNCPLLMARPPALVFEAPTRFTPAITSDSDEEDEDSDDFDAVEDLPPPETLGGGDPDQGDDSREQRLTSRFMRNYKIQEVIRRRQILLVQVVKEERGTKGAALTTYLSLAGRFGVLMPNSPRGGGISRKITSAADRRRLKEVMAELDIPRGMGLIVRTAGANRPKPEIKRDCEYLLRLWDDIREHTLKSVAPALIYEEASLIKRAIRDVYSRDIDEIQVDGEDGWRSAHEFMRMLMPSHAKKVQLWRDGGQPLFARYQVEAQLDAMLSPTAQLRSGGYLVINQTEALVAIDVNSGRSTRERNVEETALRTNLEAADEAARQLRLRDLAGLIVIDFIDMESKRHNAMVERRIKEALKNDRARIQVGHISHFGLLEMSRQRLRPSLAETSFIPCPHCGGTGHVRSTENAAIHVLRGIEDEGSKRRASEIMVHVATSIALYLLNHKRERLREIEQRYYMRVVIAADDTQIAPHFRIDRVRVRSPEDFPVPVTLDRPVLVPPELDVEEEEDVVAEDEDSDADEEVRADAEAPPGETAEEAERRRRRRRRRRRGGRREDGAERAPDQMAVVGESDEETTEEAEAEPAEAPAEAAVLAEASEAAETVEAGADPSAEEDSRNRRRGRRGGRRRRREGEGEISPFAVPGADQPELPPVYAGPTPADPFGQTFDIFDVMEQVERQAEAAPTTRATPAAPIVNTGAPEPEPEATPGEPVAVADLRDAGDQVPWDQFPQEQIPQYQSPGDQAAGDQASVDEAPGHEAPGDETPASAAAETPPEPAPTPEPVAAADSEIQNFSAPEPAPEQLAVAPAPDVPTPANDVAPQEPPPPAPAILPILVGAGDEPVVEKKRGWWRR